MITRIVQCHEVLDLKYTHLRSNWYTLSSSEITAHVEGMSWVFNSDSKNFGQIANLKAGGKRAGKTAQSAYGPCHDMIRTQILNWSQSYEVEMPGLRWINWPNCNSPGFRVVKPVATIRFRSQPYPGTVANTPQFNKWQWMIYHWLINWTWNSLCSLRAPSTIVWQNDKQARAKRFSHEEHLKNVRGYGTTQPWGSMELHGSTHSRKEQVKPNDWKNRVRIVIVWYDKMRIRWCLSAQGSPEYLLPVTTQRCTWRQWTSEFGDAIREQHWVITEMHWDAGIERVWRPNCRPRLSEPRDALGGSNWTSAAMHKEANIEWTQWCTWRPWLSEFGDALGGRDWGRLKMQLQTGIEWTLRCNGRPWSRKYERCTWRLRASEFRDVPQGGIWMRLMEYLDAADLEGHTMASETLFIG